MTLLSYSTVMCAGDTTDQNTYTTATYTPTVAGKLVIIGLCHSASSGPPNATSITGASISNPTILLAFHGVSAVNSFNTSASPTHKQEIWVAISTATPSTLSIVIGGTPTGCTWSVTEVTGADTSQAAFGVLSAVQGGVNAGTSVSLAISSFAVGHSENGSYVMACTGTNTDISSVDNAWSRGGGTALSTPNTTHVCYTCPGTSKTFTGTWNTSSDWSGFILEIAALTPIVTQVFWTSTFESNDFSEWTSRDVNAQLATGSSPVHTGGFCATWSMTGSSSIALNKWTLGIRVPYRVEFWWQGAGAPSAGNWTMTAYCDAAATNSWTLTIDWLTNTYRANLSSVYNDSGTDVGPGTAYAISDGGSWHKFAITTNPGVGGNVTLVVDDGAYSGTQTIQTDNASRGPLLDRLILASATNGTHMYFDDFSIYRVAYRDPMRPVFTDLNIDAMIVDDIARKWDDPDVVGTVPELPRYPRTVPVSRV